MINFMLVFFLGYLLDTQEVTPCSEKDLVSEVKKTEFIEFDKMSKNIDWAVRYLHKNNHLYITDKKNLYNSTDIRDSKKPNSLLLFGGKNSDLLIIAVERGGYFPTKIFFVLKKCKRKIFIKELFFENKEILSVKDIKDNL